MECPFLRRCGYYPHLQNCANGSYTTLEHNMFFNTAHYLHKSGTAAHRIRTADNLCKIRVIRCVFYSI